MSLFCIKTFGIYVNIINFLLDPTIKVSYDAVLCDKVETPVIFLTTFMKWRKGEKQRNSGNHSSLMMRKKTVIIALLHLKYHLQESKKGKLNRIYDIMSAITVICVC